MAPLGETGGIPRAEPQPRLVIAAIVAFLSVLNASASMASTVSAEVAMRDLSRLSIEELANIDISSVSKTDQPLSEAAAAIYVITHDDIVRSGASRLPEILRPAPNLQVAQVTATSYAISARGFNGFLSANKLLVLIDGRSVYEPLHAGVFWDARLQMLVDTNLKLTKEIQAAEAGGVPSRSCSQSKDSKEQKCGKSASS